MFRRHCTVLENKKVAPGHYALTLRSADIARQAKPGQFVQILCADAHDPLLPRPFSFLTANTKDFSILYHVIGRGTELLSKAKKGDFLWAVGPLGNGFSAKSKGHPSKCLLVGGGVGIPPLFHLAQTFLKNKNYNKKDIKVILGARNKSLLLCENEFKKLGVDLSVATDDGSKGHHGFVTELLKETLGLETSDKRPETKNKSRQSLVSSRWSRIFACGPTPMLKAVSVISEKFKAACEVSVEVPMACGFGACLGCAIKLRLETRDQRQETKSKSHQFLASSPQSQDYRFAIACCEGPVFQAGEILWE